MFPPLRKKARIARGRHETASTALVLEILFVLEHFLLLKKLEIFKDFLLGLENGKLHVNEAICQNCVEIDAVNG